MLQKSTGLVFVYVSICIGVGNKIPHISVIVSGLLSCFADTAVAGADRSTSATFTLCFVFELPLPLLTRLLVTLFGQSYSFIRIFCTPDLCGLFTALFHTHQALGIGLLQGYTCSLELDSHSPYQHQTNQTNKGSTSHQMEILSKLILNSAILSTFALADALRAKPAWTVTETDYNMTTTI